MIPHFVPVSERWEESEGVGEVAYSSFRVLDNTRNNIAYGP